MKFEDLLMQPSEEKQQIKDLEEEVQKLHQELDGELQIKRVLQCALRGPIQSCPCSSLLLPSKVQMLLTELKMVEEEVILLEIKVDELKLNLCQEKKGMGDAVVQASAAPIGAVAVAQETVVFQAEKSYRLQTT